MSALTAERFEEFYKAIHGFTPFPWQIRLASRVCDPTRVWPCAIALPTAAGKTACIDIAVFALACQAELGSKRVAPRRIFFVVDRRIVVDQAFLHAKKIVEALKKAESRILIEVAEILCNLAGGQRPLDVYALRGGMYRETAWVRSPLQPTIIASTVDQVGSRLLFRGYGVSDSMKPIHAGLVGNDALFLLDEAHCAKPFEQTVRSIEKYRQWGEGLQPPFRFVSITATPSSDLSSDEIERDNEEDRAHKVLGPRIAATKPTQLVIAQGASGRKWQAKLIEELEKQARDLMGKNLGEDEYGQTNTVRAVGVIVNRVATARELARKLRETSSKGKDQGSLPDVILLTGRMRPIDRDEILKQLGPLFSGSKESLERPVFVVATQCLEVGADLDFHGLVTECASFDSLRQRFGRLNRIAARPSAKAGIVIREDQVEDTETDPVYGKSLADTWKWLNAHAIDGIFDFGVAAVSSLIDGKDLSPLNTPALDAPVLFPSHLDCWVQTYPIPTPDPDPAVFLHGLKSGMPDVQVVFRGDLGEDSNLWAEIVALCPPSSSEALPVRIDVFRRWLTNSVTPDESSDVEGDVVSEEMVDNASVRRALRWRGPNPEKVEKRSSPMAGPAASGRQWNKTDSKKSRIVDDPYDVFPGDTFVVPITVTDVESLGDFLTSSPSDCGDEAFQKSRDRAIIRINDLKLEDVVRLDQLRLKEDEEDFETALTKSILARETPDSPEWLRIAVEHLKVPSQRVATRHPIKEKGWVVLGRNRLHKYDPTFLEDDESSESPARVRVGLEEHSRGVADFARKFAEGCGLDGELYATAGFFHDLGKLDPRFQAMLKGCSPRVAGGSPLAKSGTFGSGNREIHRYPANARHELLSTALLVTVTDDDLLLHLSATHHGSARPFADPVEENESVKKPFTAKLFDQSFTIDSSAQMPGQWNTELAERFWRVIRRFGWWGVTYREAIFRLADHSQSRVEQETKGNGEYEPLPTAICGVPPIPARNNLITDLQRVELVGLDGSNPLGFLAALGTLRILSIAARQAGRPCWLKLAPKLSWNHEGATFAVLHLAGRPTTEELTKFLEESLIDDFKKHPSRHAMSLLELAYDIDRRRRLRELTGSESDRIDADWITALFAELAPQASSQLLMVRRDYFQGNIQSILKLTTGTHIHRSLFRTWDFSDPLDNRSFHWDPSEDRRHAYQWNEPSGDPSRKKQGGMLGANRLAFEAWPMFFSIENGEKMVTRGFFGARVNQIFWTWPLWSCASTSEAISSLLALKSLQEQETSLSASQLRDYNIFHAFRCQRILVGKTPNLVTPLPVI